MSWFDVPSLLERLVHQGDGVRRQVQRVFVATTIDIPRQIREQGEQIMAVGNKVLAALAQIDDAITSEADDLAAFVAERDSIDEETSKLLLDRVARIKAIVPEKAPAVGEAADDGAAQPPADLPVADEQTPPAPPTADEATDATGNADVAGDGVNGETGTTPTA